MESSESFQDIFSEYERSRSQKREELGKGLEGTVISVSADSVLLDVGFKTEGILPVSALPPGREVKPGDKLPVTITGRDPEGYYKLALGRLARATDWSALEKAFAEKATIAGNVTGVIKGGLSVDVGVRAFLPASRSGVREPAEMEKLVGQEIRCRIIKLDVADEDVVVDRRAVLEQDVLAEKDRRYGELREGDIVRGEVRSLTDYGAFVGIGGVDALLHVSDISWARVNKPADALEVGQQIEVKVLKIDAEKRRISVGMKQLQPHPWEQVAETYKVGERVRGTVTRTADFGAFVELAPGIEGLIHISELSWSKRIKRASDIVKPGDTVEVVILGVNTVERRMSLGLKQALGDPWADAGQKFGAGAVAEGPVTNLTKFGAFVQLAEGIEGMVHISEITTEKRLNHPQEVLRVGQVVKAKVLEFDKAKRVIRLSIKQLEPTGLDEYMAEHKEGDVVSGRMMEVSNGYARVELGEGVLGTCRVISDAQASQEPQAQEKTDVSSLSSMLHARWRDSNTDSGVKSEDRRAGQIRSFRITKLDPETKKIELELAS
ncbi:MAG: S1 RNA-binding domain-containing protein [Acidobacteria bacterium]|nr:S1 RNA-binding domain-containing protein [Acidobacteriota bacterium]